MTVGEHEPVGDRTRKTVRDLKRRFKRHLLALAHRRLQLQHQLEFVALVRSPVVTQDL